MGADSNGGPTQIELPDIDGVQGRIPCLFAPMNNVLFSNRVVVEGVIRDIGLSVDYISLALIVRVLRIYDEENVIVCAIDLSALLDTRQAPSCHSCRC